MEVVILHANYLIWGVVGYLRIKGELIIEIDVLETENLSESVEWCYSAGDEIPQDEAGPRFGKSGCSFVILPFFLLLPRGKLHPLCLPLDMELFIRAKDLYQAAEQPTLGKPK